DVQHGVDRVFTFERTKAVLPAPAGEAGAVAMRRDALEIQLGGPPAADAVFHFEPRRVIGARSVSRQTAGAGESDFEVAGFFEIVVVGDEVRTLLRGSAGRKKLEKQGCGGENQHSAAQWGLQY